MSLSATATLERVQTTTNTKLGGAYAWLVISLCGFFLIYKYVLQVSPSVMTAQLMRVFQVNGTGLGVLGAAYFYSYLFAQFIAGPFLDKYNPRRLTAIAIALCALGALAFAGTRSLGLATASRALIGVGAAFATLSYLKMTALWFKPQQFPFVSGLLATAAMVGAMFGEVPLSLLISHIGWQNSLYLCGLIGLVIAALFFAVVKDKKSTKPSPSQPQLTRYDFFKVLRNKNNWWLTFYSGLAFSPVAIFGGLWGNPFLETAYHLTTTQAASFTSLIFLGLAFGGPFFGWFSSRFASKIAVMAGGTTLALIACTAALYSPFTSLWLLGTALFLFGLGTGSFMLCFTIGKDLNSVAVAGTVAALINSGEAIFSSFTDPLMGKVLDLGWQGQIVDGVRQFSVQNYHWAFSLLPLYFALALFCLWRLQRRIH